MDLSCDHRWHEACEHCSNQSGIAPGIVAACGEMRRMGRAMADPLDDYIDAVAKALALPVQEDWRPAVRANLDVSLKLARMVDEFVLPDETEPASVFTA